jgi:hypothetical protein
VVSPWRKCYSRDKDKQALRWCSDVPLALRQRGRKSPPAENPRPLLEDTVAIPRPEPEAPAVGLFSSASLRRQVCAETLGAVEALRTFKEA